MEFPSILLQFENIFSSQLIKKTFSNHCHFNWWNSTLMMVIQLLVYRRAVVDGIREEKTAAFRFFCWEQFRSYEVEWKYRCCTTILLVSKSFSICKYIYGSSQAPQKNQTHARAYTNTNKSINKMKFIVRKKKFEVSELFQTILMEWNCIFFLLSHSAALNRCIASLNYFVIYILIRFFFPSRSLPFGRTLGNNTESKMSTSTGDESLISTSMESAIPAASAADWQS